MSSTTAGSGDVSEKEAKLREYVKELKQKLCKTYGKEILELPSMKEELPKIKKSDEPDVRQLKERERTRILRLREAEYEQRQSDVVERLEEIIDRVRSAIRNANVSVNTIFNGSIQNRNADLQLRMTRDRCPKCGNRVTANSIVKRNIYS
jgi:hypothetical protein